MTSSLFRATVAVGLAATALMLCACAQLDDLNAKALERREAQQKAQTTDRQASTSSAVDRSAACQSFDFVAAKDVDSAYAAAMRNFGFRTFDERKRALVNPGYPLAGDTYVHTAQPGAFYRLSDWVSLPGGTDRATWMRLELSKLGATQTGTKGYVCAKAGGPDHREALVASIKAGL
jgi:hypothetical protein